MQPDLFRECRFCNCLKVVLSFRGNRSKCKACEALSKQNPMYKEQQRAYTEHRRKNPEIRAKDLAFSRAYRTHPNSRANQMYLSARQRSQAEGLAFDLDLAFVLEKVLKGFCERSGIAFSHKTDKNRRYNPFTPSIDKIDPFKGYTKNNVQIVVWCYNAGKNQMTDAEFIAFCHAVARNNPE